MKKIALYSVLMFILFSCGKDKEEVIKEKEKVADKLMVTLEAIYTKNDSCTVFVYDENNNEYLGRKVQKEIIGSENFQSISIELPTDIKIYNLAVGFSSNKEQDSFTLKSISIKKNENVIVRSDNYNSYFANNDQIVMDMNTSIHKLKHDKNYPPGFVGNDEMRALLSE